MGTTSRAYLRETSKSSEIAEFLPSLKCTSLSLKSKRPTTGQPLFVKQTSTDGQPSRPQKTVFAHKWVIRNFSRLYEDPDCLVKSKLPVLYSRKFSESSLNDARFSLRLLPEYVASGGEHFLSISLFYEETLNCAPESLSIKYEISLLDSFGQKQNRQSQHKKFSPRNTWGWEEFINLNDLSAKRDSLLSDDSLTLYCEIETCCNSCNTDDLTTFDGAPILASESESNGQMTVQRLSYEWTIDDFASYFFYDATEPVPEYFSSQSFSFQGADKPKFHLTLHPNGINESSRGYLSLFLHMEKAEEADQEEEQEVQGQYRVCLVNWKNERVNAGETRGSLTTNVGKGTPKFIHIDELLDARNGLLPRGNLIIICDIEVLEDAEEVALLEKANWSTDKNIRLNMLLELPSFAEETSHSHVPLCTESSFENAYFQIQLFIWPFGVENHLWVGMVIKPKGKDDEKAKVAIQLSALNEMAQAIVSVQMRTILGKQFRHIFEKFISHTQLRDDLLIEGKCLLRFEMIRIAQFETIFNNMGASNENWSISPITEYTVISRSQIYLHRPLPINVKCEVFKKFLNEFISFLQEDLINFEIDFSRMNPRSVNYEDERQQLVETYSCRLYGFLSYRLLHQVDFLLAFQVLKCWFLWMSCLRRPKWSKFNH